MNTPTPEELLRITTHWPQTDARRCELIEARIKNGSRTAEEEAEFQDLQRLYDLRREHVIGGIRTIFDEMENNL